MRSGLVRTEAIVLSKLKFSDSSNIVSFYTRKRGRISGLIKGARNLKSKSGLLTDVLNVVELFYYEKEGQDLFTVNSAELLFHPKEALTDINSLYCATAIAELLKELTPANEQNDRLFRGSEKILRLIETKKEDSLLLFIRYFLFILEESGVGVHSKTCAICNLNFRSDERLRFDSGRGVLCEKCGTEKRRGIYISWELYKLLGSLNSGKSVEFIERKVVSNLLQLLETYTRTHFETFKGLKALQILGEV